MFTRRLLVRAKIYVCLKEHLSKNRHSLENDCVGIKPCSKIFSPVCASVGASNKTFSNECQMRQEVCTNRVIMRVSPLQRP